MGDAAENAGFINTDGLFFVFPHSDLLAKHYKCQTDFHNNGLRSHETRTQFLGNCANMYAQCPNNNISMVFSST